MIMIVVMKIVAMLILLFHKNTRLIKERTLVVNLDRADVVITQEMDPIVVSDVELEGFIRDMEDIQKELLLSYYTKIADDYIEHQYFLEIQSYDPIPSPSFSFSDYDEEEPSMVYRHDYGYDSDSSELQLIYRTYHYNDTSDYKIPLSFEDEMLLEQDSIELDKLLMSTGEYFYEDNREQRIQHLQECNEHLSFINEQLENELKETELEYKKREIELASSSQISKSLEAISHGLTNQWYNVGPTIHLSTQSYKSLTIYKVLDLLQANRQLKEKKEHLMTTMDSICYNNTILSHQLSQKCIENEYLLVQLDLAQHMKQPHTKKRKRSIQLDPIQQIEPLSIDEQLNICINLNTDLLLTNTCLQDQIDTQNTINDSLISQIREFGNHQYEIEMTYNDTLEDIFSELSSLGSEGIDIAEHRHIGLLSDIRGNIDEKNEIQEQINVLSRKIMDLETYKPLFLKACEEIEEEKKIILSEFSNYGYLNVIQSFLEK